MREDRCALGSSAHVPDVWRYALLRQLPARGERQRLVPISGDSKIGLVFDQPNSSVAELFYDRNCPVS